MSAPMFTQLLPRGYSRSTFSPESVGSVSSASEHTNSANSMAPLPSVSKHSKARPAMAASSTPKCCRSRCANASRSMRPDSCCSAKRAYDALTEAGVTALPRAWSAAARGRNCEGVCQRQWGQRGESVDLLRPGLSRNVTNKCEWRRMVPEGEEAMADHATQRWS